MNPSAPPQTASDPQRLPPFKRLFFLVLLLTLVRGLLYLAVLPPWQHYDEPTHFEYARLIAELRRLPTADDYDLEMRREIAASMKAFGYYRQLGEPVINLWSEQPPYIGLPELSHPPSYYVLQALPQWLASHQSVETQLYLARLVSILFYLLIVASAHGLVTELLPGRPGFALAVAAFVALLPPFTDLMTAVNNDVAAVAAVTLLLWASVRLLRRGLTWQRAVAVVTLAGACLAIKNTASAAALAALLALGIGLVPASKRRWLGWGAFLLLPVALLLTCTWGRHAAFWYSEKPTAAANRIQGEGLLGESALALSATGDPYPQRVFQELEREAGQRLRGQPVTLGAWLKTPSAAEATVVLRLHDGQSAQTSEVRVTGDWQFHALTATIGADAPGVAAHVILSGGADPHTVVAVDGLVLAAGEGAIDQEPVFADEEGRSGQWGGEPFVNLLRNPSAEKGGPGLRRWIGDKQVYRQPLAWIVTSLLDGRRTAWVYGRELLVLHNSFWGRLSWGHLSLPDPIFYGLLVVTALACVGCLRALARQVRAANGDSSWKWAAWGVLGAVWLAAWGSAVLRIHPMILTRNFMWPMARYAAAAIVPTAAFLCVGLYTLTPRRWRRWSGVAGLGGMVTLDALVLLTVLIPFYYG